MSWQAYVDTSLVGTGQIDKAAISSVTGDSIWAATEGFQPSPKELQDIIKAFGDSASAFANGIHVGGVKYVTIKAESESLYGKQGKEGIVIAKTKQAILIGHYGENVQPGNATKIVEGLKDYLVGVGY